MNIPHCVLCKDFSQYFTLFEMCYGGIVWIVRVGEESYLACLVPRHWATDQASPVYANMAEWQNGGRRGRHSQELSIIQRLIGFAPYLYPGLRFKAVDTNAIPPRPPPPILRLWRGCKNIDRVFTYISTIVR